MTNKPFSVFRPGVAVELAKAALDSRGVVPAMLGTTPGPPAPTKPSEEAAQEPAEVESREEATKKPKPGKQTSPVKAKAGGRKRKWEDYYRLACEILKESPKTSFPEIASKYNRRYSNREHLNGEKARKIFSRYRKSEQNHD